MRLVDSITPSARVSPKKCENFSTKLTEVENGFFLLNVQGKIEMLNLLFFYYGKQHGSFKFEARARAFWKIYKKLLLNPAKQATLKDLKCTENDLTYIMDKATIEE